MIDAHNMQLFRLQADICKTLADSNRLMIIHELRQGEKSVGQLVSILGLPQSNVSRHLAVLRERDIVFTRRKGTAIYYSLDNPKIGKACDLVREVLESHLAQSQALLSSLDTLGREIGKNPQ
jgi:ArsR family transcriptional regulator